MFTCIVTVLCDVPTGSRPASRMYPLPPELKEQLTEIEKELKVDGHGQGQRKGKGKHGGSVRGRRGKGRGKQQGGGRALKKTNRRKVATHSKK